MHVFLKIIFSFYLSKIMSKVLTFAQTEGFLYRLTDFQHYIKLFWLLYQCGNCLLFHYVNAKVFIVCLMI